MNSRRIVTGLFVVFAALLIWWIYTKTEWVDTTVAAPLKGDAVNNPFYSAQHFVDALDGKSEWRKSLGSTPTTDAVLVLSYWNWSLIESRRHQIEAWVAAGGRLVIDRTLIGGEKELQSWTGVSRAYPKRKPKDDVEEDEGEDTEETTEEDKASPSPQKESRNQEKPTTALRLPRSDVGVCTRLAVDRSDYGDQQSRPTYNVCNLTDRSWLVSQRKPSWALSDKQGLQAIRVPIGKGSVTVINANPFGNRELLELDHASLFTAAARLHRGDHVVFLSEEERTSLPGLIWENAAAVVLLFATLIAAVLWRGAVRFGPQAAPTEVSRRSLAEQIVGSGWFTLRLKGVRSLHAAAVRSLNEAANRRIPNYTQLTTDARVTQLARITGIDKDKLAATLYHNPVSDRAELRRAIAQIETVRRTLIASHIEVFHAS